MAFTTDLVGFSGTRSYQSVAHPVSRTTILAAIVAALTAAGWTKLSGPTAGAFGDRYEFYSAQSPWYNDSNVPSWYTGGRVYLNITHPNSTQIAFQVGEYYAGAIEEEMSGTDRFVIAMGSYTGASQAFRCLANPYELYIWHSGTDTDAGGQDRNFYCGALNIPMPLQQGQRAISCILATKFGETNGLLVGNSQIYSLWRDRTAVKSFYISNSNGKVQFIQIGSGAPFGNNGRAHARRLWYRANDLNMSDNTKWQPFFCPAQVSFPIEDYGNNPTFNGFMWDTVVCTDGFELNSTFHMIGKAWVNIWGTNAASDNNPAGLWLNYGNAGDTL